MGTILFAYLPALLGMLVIALFVYFRQRRPMYVAFAITFLAVILWQGFQFASLFIPIEVSVWTMRASLIASNFLNPTFLLFTLLYPAAKKWPSFRITLLIFTPAIVLIPLSLLPEMLTWLERKDFDLILHTGYLYDVQAFIGVSYIIAALSVLIWKYRREARQHRVAILMLFFAFLFPLIVGLLANYLWINAPGAQYWLPSAFFATALMVAYAMIKHKLFDIRLAVARAVGYVLLLITLLALYTIAVFLVTQLLFGESAQTMSSTQSLVYFVFAILLAFTFNPLKAFFDKITDRLFYRREYDAQEVLSRLGDVTANEVNLKRLSNDVVGILFNAVKPESVYIHITSHRNQLARTFALGEKPDLFNRKLTSSVERYAKKVILTDYIDESDEALQEQLVAAGAAVVVHLETSRELIGHLVLGAKRSGKAYGSKDEQFFKTIGSELALAIQNSLRFEEIQDFNDTLQDKVDSATERISNTNRKLRQLDVTKDEFVSMASHQLRTPLTSVKGYLSMVLEGDAGKLNATQEKLLKEAFTSSERMVRLISDFLNVSRLRTGKFVVERSMVNLANLIEGEISQLEATAATRELKLHYDKPTEFPTLRLDKGKIQQVMMNLIDNAIFYSNPGGVITVELLKKHGEVIFRVKDQGIGVPAHEKRQLFTKFYRASNARKQRPDGTGIGLFMARKIVVAHKGAIIFESTEGQGSTFGFRLPIEQPSILVDTKRLG
jgi:signal transduction histidine kinase